MAVAEPPLKGLLAVEHGERLGAAVCGTLLAHLGADVAIIETDGAAPRYKWLNRTSTTLGKRSVLIRTCNAEDQAFLNQLLGCADIVVKSSDIAACPAGNESPAQIICDITAYGADGPLSGTPHSDALVQAMAGLADTTGDPGAEPSLIGIPFCEVSAGIYAAAAILVAHRVRRMQGFGQHIDIALYDCAVGALSTFLPFHAAGKAVTRSGNRHSLAAPWNAYRGSDGWVLICTATDEQWRRLCMLIGEPGLAQKEGFVTNAERITRRGEVDAVIQRWTATQTVAQCIERLSGIDIACGPILPLAQLPHESNLVYRKMIWRAVDASGSTVPVPGSPLAASLPVTPGNLHVPTPDEHRAELKAILNRARNSVSRINELFKFHDKPKPFAPGSSPGQALSLSKGEDKQEGFDGLSPNGVTNFENINNRAALPLTGLRVLEIGQYTTAPLVGRQLGMLCAQVFKIEPPGGEGSRSWPPLQGDRGYFFALSNNDKRSLELNLQDKDHRAVFVSLLKTADVLVENLKPGSLARLGFGVKELHDINPHLIYCGISGFGANSIFPGRPAFDTVVQAMSGFMDVTRSLGAPTKAGISAADIVGGEYGLLAILAALEVRDQSGHGLAIDISMQDAAVSATASLWNAPLQGANAYFLRCANGYVCVEQPEGSEQAALDRLRAPAATANLKRDEVVAHARAAGLSAAPVCSVSEAATSAQSTARNLIVEKPGADGRIWPLLNSALRLSRTPPQVHQPIGDLGEANVELGLKAK